MSLTLTKPQMELPPLETLKELASQINLNEVRVTRLEDFRVWREQELEDSWLLPKVLGLETEDPAAIERMTAGTALHSVFETSIPDGRESLSVEHNGYRFDFNCGDIDVMVAPQREVELVRDYDGFTVTGHADGIWPDLKLITDYKTTQRFDFDRYMESYQWKFYLDMSGCNEFLYQVFEMKPFGRGGPEHSYSITEFHTLKQYRYPTLHEDCLRLVKDYRETVVRYLEKMTN